MLVIVQIDGNKQYIAKEGSILKLEKMTNNPGEIVEFNKVLMFNNGHDIKFGNPYIMGIKVIAEVIKIARNKKIKIIKFRRRKNSIKHQGHRQYFTEIKIKSIENNIN